MTKLALLFSALFLSISATAAVATSATSQNLIEQYNSAWSSYYQRAQDEQAAEAKMRATLQATNPAVDTANSLKRLSARETADLFNSLPKDAIYNKNCDVKAAAENGVLVLYVRNAGDSSAYRRLAQDPRVVNVADFRLGGSLMIRECTSVADAYGRQQLACEFYMHMLTISKDGVIQAGVYNFTPDSSSGLTQWACSK